MIDTYIFIGFLLTNIVWGLFSSRGVVSLKEFAIGNQTFSTSAIAATIIATYLSGSGFFSDLNETYNNGLYYIWTVIAAVIIMFGSMAFIFAPRMGEFLGKLSIADAMGDLFGKEVRIITAVAGFLGRAGFIAAQLKVAGKLCEYGLNISPTSGIIMIGLIITGYASLGGIKSVTVTDFMQLIIFGTIIPTLAYFIMTSMENIQPVINMIQTSDAFNYHEVFDFTREKSLKYLSLFIIFAIPGFSPSLFQRIVIAKNINQVIKSNFIAGVICLIIVIITCFISVLVMTNPDVQGQEVLPFILSNYSCVGLRGLTIVAIMAMVMSTADSHINSSSVLFIHDFCKPLNIDFKRNELLAARLASALIGTISIYFAIYSPSLLDLIKLANTFFVPVVTPSFMMAIFGFRPHKTCVLLGMLGGVISTIAWKFIIKYDPIDSLIPGMLLNFIFLFGSHYILKLPGGWVGIKDIESLELVRQSNRLRVANIKENIVNFSLKKFFQQNSLKPEQLYIYFGAFCLISCMINIFTLPSIIYSQYSSTITFLHLSIMLLSTILISYPLWKEHADNILVISGLWHFSAFYILICTSLFLVLITKLAPMQLMFFLLYLIILALSMTWYVALFMLVMGTLATFTVFNIIAEQEILIHFSQAQFQIGCLLLFSTGLLVVFRQKDDRFIYFKEKVSYLNNALRINNVELRDAIELKHKFINNITHEYHAPMTGVISTAQTLYECYDKLDDSQRILAAKTIYESALRLESFENNLDILQKFAQNIPNIRLEEINLSNIILSRLTYYQKMNITDAELNHQTFRICIEENILIKADKYYLTLCINNLIINALTFCPAGIIEITLKLQNDEIHFAIKDQGIGIPDNELRKIFEEFIISSRTESPAGGRGLGLTVCKKVIEAHNGSIWAENCPTVFRFILPLKRRVNS